MKGTASRVIDNRFEDETADMVMDMIQEADSANTNHRNRTDLDDEKRQEKQFMSQFCVALNNQLLPAGLHCIGMTPDGEGRGYVIYCRDGQGRPYEVQLGFDEWLSTVERIGGDAGREMLHTVCSRILEAREKYFRRMTS